jgi:hypothetical protein
MSGDGPARRPGCLVRAAHVRCATCYCGRCRPGTRARRQAPAGSAAAACSAGVGRRLSDRPGAARGYARRIARDVPCRRDRRRDRRCDAAGRQGEDADRSGQPRSGPATAAGGRCAERLRAMRGGAGTIGKRCDGVRVCCVCGSRLSPFSTIVDCRRYIVNLLCGEPIPSARNSFPGTGPRRAARPGARSQEYLPGQGGRPGRCAGNEAPAPWTPMPAPAEICPLAAMMDWPETASPITECDWPQSRSRA